MTNVIVQLQNKIRSKIMKLDTKQNYQKYLIIFMLAKTVLDDMSGTMPDFIFMNPLFQCNGVLTTQDQACKIIDKCKITNNFTAIIPTHLYCQNQDYRSVVQSVYNFGVIVGMLTLVPFGDFGGKKPTILISIVMQILGILLTLFGIYEVNWTILNIGQFILGVSFAGFDIACYVMTVQYLRDKLCQKILMVTCAFWGVSQMLFLLIYYYLPQWYNFLLYILLIPNVACLFIASSLLIEHPSFVLFKRKNLKKFIKNVEKLSVYNQSSQNVVEELKHLGRNYIQQSKTFAYKRTVNKKKQICNYLKKLYCNRNNVVPLICLILIYSGINIYQSGMADSMQRTGYNYGVSMFIVGIQQFICYIAFSFISNKYRRKRGLAISTILVVILGLLFLHPSVKQNQAISSAIIFVSTAFDVFAYSFFVLIQVQAFPVQVMSTAQGTIGSLGEISLLFVPYLVIKMNNLGIHPIVALSVFLFGFGLLPIVFLKQTLGTFKANPQKQDMNQQQSIMKEAQNQLKEVQFVQQ